MTKQLSYAKIKVCYDSVLQTDVGLATECASTWVAVVWRVAYILRKEAISIVTTLFVVNEGAVLLADLTPIA